MPEHTPHVLADGFAALEGPRWRDGRLYVADMHGHAVYALGLDGAREQLAALPGDVPSGLGWLPDGRLLIVGTTERKLWRLEHGELVEHADLSTLTDAPVNDMYVAPDGSAYVTGMGFDVWKALTENPDLAGLVIGDLTDPAPVIAALPRAQLFRVDPGGAAQVVADDLLFPNGIVATPDGRGLIVAESLASRLVSFDLTPGGALGPARTYAELESFPDGIAVDATGAVWVASPLTGSVIRVTRDGTVTDRFEVGGICLSCALGGPTGQTLFACVAPALSEEDTTRLMESRVVTFEVEVPAPA